MSKYLSYGTWVATPIVLSLFLQPVYGVFICAIFLTIEILYFVINKYFGSLIQAFGSSALKSVVFCIKDYNKFWFNFAVRVVCYTVGILVSFCVVGS